MNDVTKKQFIFIGFLVVIMGILAFIDYELFHFLIDFFNIFIGLMVFIIVINSKVYKKKSLFYVLAVAYLYISCFDLLHLITLYDISEVGQNLDHSYKYFASARIFEAFIIVLLFGFRKKISEKNFRLTHIVAIVILILSSIIIRYDVFDPFYVEGYGQTTMKLIQSYFTTVLFIVGAFFAYKSPLEDENKKLIVVVLLLKAFAQLIHGSFINMGDAFQIIAMMLRFLSYGGLYIIFIQEIVANPYRNVYKQFESKEQELLTLSERDSLTGIFNHSLTFRNIEIMISKIGKDYKNLCVILFDIDNFKQINDSFGHIKGDEMLKKFTSILQEIHYPEKMVGRYGGDEFVLAIPNCLKTDVKELFESLNSKLDHIAKEDGVLITFSAGVVIWHMGDNATDLIRKADIKMYESKHKGKNQYSVWQTEYEKK